LTVVSLASDTRLSRRPAGIAKELILPPLSTLDASRAANARVSAHETTPGQAASSAALAASITSNPRRLFTLGRPNISVGSLEPLVFLRRTEASHPRTKQSWKKRRMSPAPMPGSLLTASSTPFLTTTGKHLFADCLPRSAKA
jgi:hypothetical protein